MSLTYLIWIALLQGITEFLPISSSAHLILLPHLTGHSDQGLLIDVAAHLGSLLAVMLYFWRDLLAMFKGGIDILKGNFASKNSKLTLAIIIGTIPVIIAGFILHSYFKDIFRSLYVIAWTTLIFGIFLGIADRAPQKLKLSKLKLNHALLIGLSQILALIPGTSRSGITMTAARFIGYSRNEAAHFSLLLSIPTILGSNILLFKDILEQKITIIPKELFLTTGMTFFISIFAIHFMLQWLKKASFKPFVIYRILLGVGLLAYLSF